MCQFQFFIFVQLCCVYIDFLQWKHSFESYALANKYYCKNEHNTLSKTHTKNPLILLNFFFVWMV